MELFGVQFEGGTNPTPRAVLSASYSVAHLVALTEAQRHAIAHAVDCLAACVEDEFERWVQGAVVLQYDIKLDSVAGRQRYGLKVPPAARRSAVKRSVRSNATLRTHALRLWDVAHEQAMVVARGLHEHASRSDHEAALDAATARIREQARHAWTDFLARHEPAAPSVRDLFLASQAHSSWLCAAASRASGKPSIRPSGEA